MTAEDLINLAQDGEAADFRDAVKELLTNHAQSTITEMAANYDPLKEIEEVAEEDGDEIDLDDDNVDIELDETDALAELAAEFSDEDLEAICNTMTEEEFEELDDLSKALLADYVARTTEEE